MKTINATQAKRSFRKLLNNAQQAPVSIQKRQKTVAILLSSVRYQELAACEAYCLNDLAVSAEQEGYIGPVASKSLLDSI